jgi:hypothetical protein
MVKTTNGIATQFVIRSFQCTLQISNVQARWSDGMPLRGHAKSLSITCGDVGVTLVGASVGRCLLSRHRLVRVGSHSVGMAAKYASPHLALLSDPNHNRR